MKIILPYPPSINHYWRHFRSRTIISNEGREFRALVVASAMVAGVEMLTCPLRMTIDIYPPDKRRRDLDNVQKPILDALQHAGYYKDDSQVDWLLTRRNERAEGGRAEVEIEPIGATH